MTYIYEDRAYGPDVIDNCYWARTVTRPIYPSIDQDYSCDVVIVGAGFTGLSAAYHLAKDGANVILIDAQYPAFGASGRNGGFCCLGGTMADDAVLDRRFGPQGRRAYHQSEAQAVDLVQSLLQDLDIDPDRHSQGETCMAHRLKDAQALKGYGASHQDNYGVASQFHNKDELSQMGLNGQFFGATTVPIGFALNPQKYAFGLLNAAQGLGAQIFANSSAASIDEQGVIANGHRITASKVILATNGYSSETLVPWMRSRFLPVQSSILVTRPITPEEQRDQGWTSQQMAYDTRDLLHYFRLMPDGRFLFGMRGGIFSTETEDAKIQAQMRHNFKTMFPKWSHVDIDYDWSGLVCLTSTLLPYVGPIPDQKNVFTGFGYHGNGVAMATYSGAILAGLVQGKTPRLPYPEALKTVPKRFPLGRFRRHLLRPAYWWMRKRDA